MCTEPYSGDKQGLGWTEAVGCVQGEGEVKILSRILRPWADAAPDDDHAVVALDSDMALMALMMPNPNVYVLAEPARYMHTPAKLHVWSSGFSGRNSCRCSARFPAFCGHEFCSNKHNIILAVLVIAFR